MASSKEYLDYILDQLSELDDKVEERKLETDDVLKSALWEVFGIKI